MSFNATPTKTTVLLTHKRRNIPFEYPACPKLELGTLPDDVEHRLSLILVEKMQ